jgi:hypothetical protein
MELQHIKHIEEAVKKHATWTTKKLVFKVDAAVGLTMIDVIPYLFGCSGGPKLGTTLSFPHPQPAFDPKGVDCRLQEGGCSSRSALDPKCKLQQHRSPWWALF